MSGISSLNNLSSVAQSIVRPTDTSKVQQTLLEKVDSNGDQAIDKTELSSFLEYVNSKTGAEGPDADAVFSSLDSDGDGSITTDELSANADTLIDQLKDQLRSAQLGGALIDAANETSDSRPPPPPGPPPGPPPDQANGGSGSPLDSLLTSLIQQYQSVSTANSTSTSAVNSLSEVA